MFDADTINTINAEEEHAHKSGAYPFSYTFGDLFEIEASPALVVRDILIGSINVEGFSDPIAVAEDYLSEVEERWPDHNTSSLWDSIRRERDTFLALSGPLNPELY